MTTTTKTSAETAEELMACRAALAEREEMLDGLEAKQPELRAACAADMASTEKRTAFDALKVEILRTETDVEILAERVILAERAHANAKRTEGLAELERLTTEADPHRMLRTLNVCFVQPILQAQRAIEEALAKMNAVVGHQRRLMADAEDLARELGVPCAGWKLDAETVQLVGSRLLATSEDVSAVLVPMADAEFWDGTIRRRRCDATKFALAGEYIKQMTKEGQQ